MAKLQELLGDAFKEDMTLDEIHAALAEVQVAKVDPDKPLIEKSKFDNLASEAAEYKRKVKELEQANLTEEQRREAEAQELKEQLATLRKASLKSEATAQLAKVGIANDDIANSLSERFEDSAGLTEFIGLMTGVISQREKDTETRVKKDIIDATPVPPASDPKDPQAEFKAMNVTERMELKAKNPSLYEQLKQST